MSNRYVYLGSMTTPPCAQGVYWNVLHKVYPIGKEYIELFQKQLVRGESGKLRSFGNWRMTQLLTTQAPAMVVTKDNIKLDASAGLAAKALTFKARVDVYNQSTA